MKVLDFRHIGVLLVTIFCCQANSVEIANFSFDNGVSGSSITEFARVTAPAKTVYSNVEQGPSDTGMTVRMSNDQGNKSFGGQIATMNLGEGQEVWVRWYQYFPHGFKFANGTNGDSNGGAGRIKWLRFQYPGNSERITFEIDAKAGCGAPCNDAFNVMSPESIIGEAQGWRERYNNQMVFVRNYSPPQIPTGQWHALQMYMRLSTGSADKGDGNGIIRLWVDDQFVIEVDRNTMPLNGGNLKSVWLGNYWNGGFPADQHFFVDDLIITSTRPSTVDSGGRHYIAPGDVPDPVSPPNPPSAFNVQLVQQ